MAQNSITPQQKAQAVDLGGMMAHVQAALQRYKTEVSDHKAASDHNHDSAYAAKSTFEALGLSVVNGQLCQTYTT